MSEAIIAEPVLIGGGNGDQIEAYLARPLGDAEVGGVVVIHHLPGYDRATREITRRFATLGYNAICLNLYLREGLGVSPDDAAAAVRARGGLPDDQLVGDVDAAARHLRSLPGSTGRVAVIGYCSGGRQALLAACRLPLDAAIDCYGAFVVSSPPDSVGLKSRPIVDLIGDLSCPLLGLFGADDSRPTPAETAELEKVLKEHGKEYEFHTYEGAAHAFFAVDRPAYRPEAAGDGWRRIESFLGRHLATGGAG